MVRSLEINAPVYDANGNMITDKNKHITSIEYNYLNLPTRVVFDNQTGGTNDNVIEYVYDAAGVKQAKIVTSYSGISDNYINTTQYAGNFVYKGTKTVGSIGLSTVSLEFFNHPEGYTEPYKAGKATLYRYIYQMKDHLGNIRVSYCDYDKDGVVDLSRKATNGTEILLDIDGDGDFENEIVQTKNYYPFGLQHNYGNNSPMSVVNGRDHKYGYNGIEKEESFDFNMNEMDMRFYDSALARWVVQDPIIHFGYSPYNAFDNNPIYWADPSGADATQTEKGVTYTGQDAVNALRQISMSTTATNGSGDDEDEETKQKNKRLNAEANVFGKSISLEYTLVDDKKDIHKLTLRGTKKLKNGHIIKSTIEIIIEANKGNPKIASSILTSGEYNYELYNDKYRGFEYYTWMPIEELSKVENYSSALTEYISDPLIKELNLNPEYNPWNGNVKTGEVFSYIAGTTAVVTGFTGKNLVKRILGKKWFKYYYAAAGGVFFGNLFRNNYDHSGKHIKYNFRTGEVVSRSSLFY